MVIDTSAIAAIAFNEPEARGFHEKIADDPVRLISAATVLEAAMVIEARFGEAGGADLDLWLHKTGAEIVAVTAEHADQARPFSFSRLDDSRPATAQSNAAYAGADALTACAHPMPSAPSILIPIPPVFPLPAPGPPTSALRPLEFPLAAPGLRRH